MSEVRKHIEENYERCESAYNDIYYRLDTKVKILNRLKQEVDLLKIDFENALAEKEYFYRMLNELNNENHE